MKLTEQQIIEVAKKVHPKIMQLRKEATRLKMNILGKNYLDFLKQKQGLENDLQYDLRKRHSMSNRGVWSQLFQPFNSIYTAMGGSSSYYSKTKDPVELKAEMNQYIQSNSDEYISLMQFTTDYFKSILTTDPNGFTLIDWKKSGFRYTPISIDAISNFKRKGLNLYEYVAYREENAKYKSKIEGLETFITVPVIAVIDDYANYFVVRDKGNYIIAPFDQPIIYENNEYKSFVHGFDKCPAIANSNFVHDDFENKQSPAWDCVELSEQLLDESSTKTGFKALHGYPLFWEYDLEACTHCNGTGIGLHGENCSFCGGTGTKKKDVSNVKRIEAPESKDSPVIAPNLAGYISPPIETWVQMDKSDEANADKLSKQLWGVIIDPIKNRTATGQIIDQQPVVRKLDEFSKAAEIFINSFVNLIGKFLYKNSFTEANIRLGDTYLILNPNELLKQYSENVSIGNNSLRTELLENYYKHRYAKNPTALLRKTKELKIEPYPHDSVAVVLALPVTETIKNRKIYFNEWNNTISDSDYIINDIAKLTIMLDNFIKNQLNNDINL